MRSRVLWAGALSLGLGLTACNSRKQDPNTLRFLIESSPNNLDVRQGTDAQSERVGGLIYDALVKKDAHFILQPWLATSWQRPDPLTWIFHIREGVRFHDGKPLTADDVAWSIRSMIDGTLITAKAGPLADIVSVTATGPLTVTVRTRQAEASLLFNLSDGLFGVVENGAGRDEGLHPVGTGPFKFVSQMQDKEVVLDGNRNYWAGSPNIAQVRFEIVPDTITAALEMRKGSADVESNVLTPDMVHALRGEHRVVVESGPGAIVMYANFNVQDPKLRDVRVRQAIAFAMDRPALIAALWGGEAKIANTLLPIGHWAAANDSELAAYPHDVRRAVALLDAAGLLPDRQGVRLRLTLKTSTDETTRLVAQAMQQQVRAAGIELSLRSAEFGTFYSDVTHGAFQMYMLRWIGSNEDPDFLRNVFASSSFPPKGSNRGRYSNPEVDSLLTQANAETNEATRRRDYVRVQQILARDLPSIPLWYPNNEVVHSKRVSGVHLDPGGTFDFLRTAELR